MKKLLIIIFIVGCSSSKDKELIQQSIEIHGEAMEIGKEIKEKIKELDSRTSSLDSLMQTTIKDSVKSFESAWEAWEASIVEVPGNDDHDHHDHDHDHTHDHSPSPDLTPEMVLEIQQDIKKRAFDLSGRVQDVLDTLDDEI